MQIFSRGFIWDIYLFDSAHFSVLLRWSPPLERGSRDARGPWRCIPLSASMCVKIFMRGLFSARHVSEIDYRW